MTKTIAKTASILSVAAAISFGAAGALADDAYHAFVAGNPDSNGDRGGLRDIVAAQPGVGSDVDRYQGIGDGNSDLMFEISDAISREHEAPRIYSDFGVYPDAQF
jgi:hypothetical protein